MGSNDRSGGFRKSRACERLAQDRLHGLSPMPASISSKDPGAYNSVYAPYDAPIYDELTLPTDPDNNNSSEKRNTYLSAYETPDSPDYI